MVAAAVKVLLVDDHEMLRNGLKSLLQHEDGMTVVGEASNGRLAIERLKELSPDVVVMDLSMPDLNGIDATRQAIAAKPGVKVIALSASDDDRSAIEMLRAGAVGYVVKVSAYDELISAIRSAINGKVYFSPSVLKRAAANGGALAERFESAFDVLSAREREVLQLIAEGKATKEVATHLHISLKTAETHRRNLMEKLNVSSVAELTKYAIREGLTSA